MKKIYLLLIIGMFLISFSSAYIPHQVDKNLTFAITSNNATACVLTTINSPNNTFYINQTATKNSQTFNFTIDKGNFSFQGIYEMNIECTDGTTVVSGKEIREVNYFGKNISEAQSTIYIGLFAILILIMFITFWGIGKLPKDNARDDRGRIVEINHLKHLRLVLWIFLYFFFTAIIFLASNLAFAFLQEELFAQLLFKLFQILLGLSPLFIIILLISFFVRLYHDRQFQRLLNRGMFPEGRLW